MKAYDIVDVFLDVMTEHSQSDIRVVVKDNGKFTNIKGINLMELPDTKEKILVFNLKEED